MTTLTMGYNKFINEFYVPNYWTTGQDCLTTTSINKNGEIKIKIINIPPRIQLDNITSKKIYYNKIVEEILKIGKLASDYGITNFLITPDEFKSLGINKEYSDYIICLLEKNDVKNAKDKFNKLAQITIDWVNKYSFFFKTEFDKNQDASNFDMALKSFYDLYFKNGRKNNHSTKIVNDFLDVINILEREYVSPSFAELVNIANDHWDFYFQTFIQKKSFYNRKCNLNLCTALDKNGKISIKFQGEDLFAHIDFLLTMACLNEGGFNICRKCGSFITGNRKKQFCGNTCLQSYRRKKLKEVQNDIRES